jgi:hypothetical protein
MEWGREVKELKTCKWEEFAKNPGYDIEKAEPTMQHNPGVEGSDEGIQRGHAEIRQRRESEIAQAGYRHWFVGRAEGEVMDLKPNPKQGKTGRKPPYTAQ